MDLITREDLLFLSACQDIPCASIYIPADPAGVDREKKRILFKNHLRRIERQLDGYPSAPQGFRNHLEQARSLIDHMSFRVNQNQGLVLLFSDRIFRTYSLPARFREFAATGRRFYLKPLIAFVCRDAIFCLIALSGNSAKFYKGSRQLFHAVEPVNMPKSLSEALKHDILKKHPQLHTGAGGAGGPRPALFHGQGIGTDDIKDRFLRYFRQVAEGLQELLREEKAPLVFSGVNYLFPIFREACPYENLLDDFIGGNPEGLEEKDLHESAWRILSLYLEKEEEQKAARYRDLVHTGRAAGDLAEIVRAAHEGRVDSLLVTENGHQWGTYDPLGHEVSIHHRQEGGDEDLLNLAAVQTMLRGGEVHVIGEDKIPNRSMAAAIFRY
jgi:hypothetical protein